MKIFFTLLVFCLNFFITATIALTTEKSVKDQTEYLNNNNNNNNKIFAGSDYSLALKKDGTVWAWGNNDDGGLGNGTRAHSSAPVQVKSLTDVIAIAGGSGHSLALKKDGTVWAWGDNGGKLGNGTVAVSNIPVQAKNLKGVIAIAGGNDFSLALKNDGTVWMWGEGLMGTDVYTRGPGSSIPLQVKGISDVIAITNGGDLGGLALKRDRTVWALPLNKYGNHDAPYPVKNLTDIIAIAGGWFHNLALKKDGTVWAWGRNKNGQLGNGSHTEYDNSLPPAPVKNLSDVMAIGGGFDYSQAVKKDGTVWAWGWNNSGQLGDGTNYNSDLPVRVKNLTDVIVIAGGSGHSLALKKDGTVWAWGNNQYGQLGNGTINRFEKTPVQVKDFP